jgi:membrane protein
MMKRNHPLQALGRFVWELARRVGTHDIASLAAIIAFYAFFSLFPLLLLIIYTISKVLPHLQIQQMLLSLMQPYFPAVDETRSFIANNLTMLANHGANIGLLSALTLLWSATSGFIGVQQAIDVVWESAQRSIIQRRLIAFLMLVILLALAIVSGIITGIYPVLQHNPWLAHGALHWMMRLHQVSRGLFPCSLLLGCLVIYRYLPSRDIPWVYLWPGAMVTMVLVEAGREVFTWYATHLLANHFQVIYGTVATVMLVILWMYLASIAMLFGAEVSATIQHLHTKRPGQD